MFKIHTSEITGSNPVQSSFLISNIVYHASIFWNLIILFINSDQLTDPISNDCIDE